MLVWNIVFVCGLHSVSEKIDTKEDSKMVKIIHTCTHTCTYTQPCMHLYTHTHVWQCIEQIQKQPQLCPSHLDPSILSVARWLQPSKGKGCWAVSPDPYLISENTPASLRKEILPLGAPHLHPFA